MGQSSAYPIWFGRAFAEVFDMLWSPKKEQSRIWQQIIDQFIPLMVKSLPPPGMLLIEVRVIVQRQGLLVAFAFVGKPNQNYYVLIDNNCLLKYVMF